MSRQISRRISLVFLFAFAGVLIYLGIFRGWEVNGSLPAEYAGYALVAFGAAGLFGFNVWRGGPFDLRLDNNEEDTDTPMADQGFLANIERRGLDAYADLRVREVWVKESRTVTAMHIGLVCHAGISAIHIRNRRPYREPLASTLLSGTISIPDLVSID